MDIRVERLDVGLDQTRRVVRHLSGVMFDCEFVCLFDGLDLGLRKDVVLRNALCELGDESGVRTAWSETLVVQQAQETVSSLDDVEDVFVVHERDVHELDLLKEVHALLLRKHRYVEELLETLVGKVDAELLKRVVFENLKAKDVENADVLVSRRVLRRLDDGSVVVRLVERRARRLVDALNQPIKQFGIHGHRQRIDAVPRFDGREGYVRHLVVDGDGSKSQDLFKLPRLDLEGGGGVLQVRTRRQRRVVRTGDNLLDEIRHFGKRIRAMRDRPRLVRHDAAFDVGRVGGRGEAGHRPADGNLVVRLGVWNEIDVAEMKDGGSR